MVSFSPLHDAETDKTTKTVLVADSDRITREQLGDGIYDAGDVWDLSVPLYTRVTLDDPRPEVSPDYIVGDSGNAVG